MKTLNVNYRKHQELFAISMTRCCRIQTTRHRGVFTILLISAISSMFAGCKKDSAENIVSSAAPVDQYTITQAISNEAQQNTIAFDGLAYLTGNLGSQSCPERHGTYFGSFYLKDWPAMGNPNYTIDETLTASAGQNFLALLTTVQTDQVKSIVDIQRDAQTELVAKREAVSDELRKFLASQTADSSAVIALSESYGALDGEISYYYATTFSQVYNTLSDEQKLKLTGLADKLGYIAPTGAFQYSQPVAMPEIMNTDYMFQ